MYQPMAFREERLETLHALVRSHPLGTLITSGPGGLLANLVPFVMVADGEKGTLRAHIARGIDQLQPLRAAAETLVVFQGPESYITPSWYVSKREHGRVVPTWNYVVVQVRGTPIVHDDPEWIRAQIGQLTSMQEGQRPASWSVSDAPDSYIQGLLKAIVGIEIPISTIEGKWKVSQNQSAADRTGVHEGMRNEGLNEEMAQIVEERSIARKLSE